MDPALAVVDVEAEVVDDEVGEDEAEGSGVVLVAGERRS